MKTARYVIPEERPVRVIVGALECECAGKRKKRVVIGPHALDQLRLALRALGSGEREPGGIDHDGQRIDAFIGIGRPIQPGGVNNQRPRWRLVAYDLASHTELNAGLRHREADEVVGRRVAEMHAAVEAVTENGNPAF